MSARIAYFSDALLKRKQYGLSRYAWSLLYELRALGSDIFPVAAQSELAPGDLRAVEERYDLERIPGTRRLVAGAWSYLGWPALERFTSEFDVLHNVELSYVVPTNRPWITTVHDIGPLTHPGWFGASRLGLKKKALAFAAKRADVIIAVSEATADAIHSYTDGAVGDRLRVIPEGVNARDFAQAPAITDAGIEAMKGVDAPFFLWTGSKLNPRKNLLRVIEAFEQLDALPHYLVIAGGVGWDSEDLLKRVEASPKAARIVRTGYVSDEQLRALYHAAEAFLYVSLMEGFGLPILEAMASGCPVVTSNCSSMPEVAGDAALLVDPYSVQDIAEAAHSIATQPTLQSDLVRRGRERVALFDWSTCASRTAELYTSVSRK
ncbi:MAG: glycosyltransferase family 1 protein [Bacteroidota bacterium]